MSKLSDVLKAASFKIDGSCLDEAGNPLLSEAGNQVCISNSKMMSDFFSAVTVSKFLELTKKHSDEDLNADNLNDFLLSAFLKHKSVKKMVCDNFDSGYDRDGAYCSFELNQDIGGAYRISIEINVEQEQLNIQVRNYRIVDVGFVGEETTDVDCLENDTLYQVIDKAVEICKSNHKSIMEHVGITESGIKSTLKKTW